MRFFASDLSAGRRIIRERSACDTVKISRFSRFFKIFQDFKMQMIQGFHLSFEPPPHLNPGRVKYLHADFKISRSQDYEISR